MGFLKSGLKLLAGGLLGGSVAKAIFGGKKKTPEAVAGPAPVPTRNMAAEAAAQSDLLAKRRGLVASQITGARGAEATARGGTKLGG